MLHDILLSVDCVSYLHLESATDKPDSVDIISSAPEKRWEEEDILAMRSIFIIYLCDPGYLCYGSSSCHDTG